MSIDTLFVNGRFLDQPLTGVQRYARELMARIDGLLDQDPAGAGLEVVCLAPRGATAPAGWKRIRLRQVGTHRGNLWEQVDLPSCLRGGLLFSPANIGPAFHANQAVTLHDASVFAVPQAYSALFRAKYRFVFGQLARRARLVLTDSVFSQRELARHLHVDPARFAVVPLGGDHLQGVAADESVLDANGLRGQEYLLMVASRSPHKNVARLIEAVRRVKGGTRFVLVGGSFKGVFRDAGPEDLPAHVTRLGYVDDPGLKALYENAQGFIFPSLYEGFGLPVLEAMSCGCPVLCSRAASLPEVGGTAVEYFDPLDVDAIRHALERFVADPALRARMKAAGRLQAAGFSWERTARETLRRITALA